MTTNGALLATYLATGSNAREELRGQLRSIERLTLQFVAVLVAVILSYATAVRNDVADVHGSSFLFCVGLLLAANAGGLVVGGALGFVFGIPKLLRSDAPTQHVDAPIGGEANVAAGPPVPRTFVGNTNLEEISDWLTKIIVGLTLVEWDRVASGGRALTGWFANALKAPGAEAMFAFVTLAAAMAGFLFFYLETRTRVTLLLVDADAAAVPGRAATLEAARAAIEAPVSTSKPLGDPAPYPKSAPGDSELLALSIDCLREPDEFAAWGAAQVRAGKMQAGLQALREAVARDPSSARYLVLLGDALMRGTGDAQRALDAYEEARVMAGDSTRILRKEMLAALYVGPPAGFRRALSMRELLASDPATAYDASVALWTAAAYGQEYDWLLKNAGSDDAKSRTRSAALAAVQDVLRLRPDPEAAERELLRQLLDPIAEGSSPHNNDLESFKSDKEFRSLILGSKFA